MPISDQANQLANLILPNSEAIRREVARLSQSNATLKQSYQRAVGFLASVALHAGGEIRVPEKYVQEAENQVMTITFKRDEDTGDLVFTAEIEPTEEELAQIAEGVEGE